MREFERSYERDSQHPEGNGTHEPPQGKTLGEEVQGLTDDD